MTNNIINLYKDLLEKNKITVTVRKSRGKDIDAACGQLANKEVNLNWSNYFLLLLDANINAL